MTTPATREACIRCGAILSRYRGNDDDLCAPCARKLVEVERPLILEPERLLYAVAGTLLTARATDPERRVHLRAELAGQGIEADHVDVFQAVQKLRRRGMTIEADERQPGHRLVGWSFRFRRRFRRRCAGSERRGQQLDLFRA